MVNTMIIKPCIENPEIITLHVTEIEGTLHPFMYEQTPEAKAISTSMGHAFHDIVQACAHNRVEGDVENFAMQAARKSAMIINNIHLNKFQKLLGVYKKSIDDKIRFFVHNLQSGAIVEYGLSIYNKKIATEVSMGMWVECGKYKVWLAGTCDILEEDCMCDIKYYSELREGKDLVEEYNKDNYMYTSLAEKLQYIAYPIMFYGDSRDEYTFIYDITDKTKAMKHERIKCKIDRVRAESILKKNIVEYFRIKYGNGQNTEETVS